MQTPSVYGTVWLYNDRIFICMWTIPVSTPDLDLIDFRSSFSLSTDISRMQGRADVFKKQIIWKLMGKEFDINAVWLYRLLKWLWCKHTGKGGPGDVYASTMFLSLTAQQCLFIRWPFLLYPTGCWSVLWWWASVITEAGLWFMAYSAEAKNRCSLEHLISTSLQAL